MNNINRMLRKYNKGRKKRGKGRREGGEWGKGKERERRGERERFDGAWLTLLILKTSKLFCIYALITLDSLKWLYQY